jgi:hypothetical protein
MSVLRRADVGRTDVSKEKVMDEGGGREANYMLSG